jgi:hypothetical protein
MPTNSYINLNRPAIAIAKLENPDNQTLRMSTNSPTLRIADIAKNRMRYDSGERPTVAAIEARGVAILQFATPAGPPSALIIEPGDGSMTDNRGGYLAPGRYPIGVPLVGAGIKVLAVYKKDPPVVALDLSADPPFALNAAQSGITCDTGAVLTYIGMLDGKVALGFDKAIPVGTKITIPEQDGGVISADFGFLIPGTFTVTRDGLKEIKVLSVIRDSHRTLRVEFDSDEFAENLVESPSVQWGNDNVPEKMSLHGPKVIRYLFEYPGGSGEKLWAGKDSWGLTPNTNFVFEAGEFDIETP